MSAQQQPSPSVVAGVQQWLQQYGHDSADVFGAVVLRLESGAEPTLLAEWPQGGVLTPPLLNTARTALQRRRPVVVVPSVRLVGSRHNRLIALPLPNGDAAPQLALALAVQAADSAALERLVREAGQAGAALLNLTQATAAPLAATSVPALREAERVLQAQARLLQPATLADGALALTTELATMLGAERVSLGVRREESIEIVAVSNCAEVRPEQSLLQLMTQAMLEAADQGARVICPTDGLGATHVVLAHARLLLHTGHGVLSVPLVHDGAVTGALQVEWAGGAVPCDERLALCDRLAEVLGPVVRLRQRVDQPWHERLAERLRAQLRRLGRRDDPLPSLIAIGAVALAFGLTLLPLPYRVTAPARIEGSVQRVVAAPFDGFLQHTRVRPGDTVKAGDVLAELADQDLKLEARKWESALAQHENSLAAALARSDRAQFALGSSKADEARAQLELVRQQLERTKLVAPIDGVVIKGDLSQTLGAPVQRGDALLTLAPAGQYRLIVDADERDVRWLQPGQAGRLVLAGLPTESLALQVERITPVATVRDGHNSFEVEARLLDAGVALRPGMQGVARIEAGQQPLAVSLTRRLTDWLRVTGWTWLP